LEPSKFTLISVFYKVFMPFLLLICAKTTTTTKVLSKLGIIIAQLISKKTGSIKKVIFV